MTESFKGTHVQIASYNTNLQGNEGLPQDLVDWLQPTLASTTPHGAPDILAVGFQELLPLYLGLTGQSRAVVDSRNALILKEVQAHTGTDYFLVARAVNVGVALLVYAKDEGIGKRVKDVQTTWTGFGPLWMGNKSAVGIRFTLTALSSDASDETFTFVNAHLTAHSHKLKARLQDFEHISKTLLFPRPSPFSLSFQQQSTSIYHTTHLFLFGDLNFRLTKNSGLEEATIRSDLYSLEGRRILALNDELSIERRKGSVFHGLKEGDFTQFQPTYKFLLGSVDKYDTKRAPAWTDRVLFATHSDSPTSVESNIIVDLYTSIPSYTTSDHKPIVAVLHVPAPSAKTEDGSPPVLASPPAHLQPAQYPNFSRFTGKVAAWILGWVWCLLRFIGMGHAGVGLSNAVLGVGTWTWWRRNGAAV